MRFLISVLLCFPGPLGSLMPFFLVVEDLKPLTIEKKEIFERISRYTGKTDN
jgi:hypothetical protein